MESNFCLKNPRAGEKKYKPLGNTKVFRKTLRFLQEPLKPLEYIATINFPFHRLYSSYI